MLPAVTYGGRIALFIGSVGRRVSHAGRDRQRRAGVLGDCSPEPACATCHLYVDEMRLARCSGSDGLNVAAPVGTIAAWAVSADDKAARWVNRRHSEPAMRSAVFASVAQVACTRTNVSIGTLVNSVQPTVKVMQDTMQPSPPSPEQLMRDSLGLNARMQLQVLSGVLLINAERSGPPTQRFKHRHLAKLDMARRPRQFDRSRPASKTSAFSRRPVAIVGGTALTVLVNSGSPSSAWPFRSTDSTAEEMEPC